MKKIFLFFVFLFCLSSYAYADKPLRVGVLISPPFSMQTEHGYTGLAVNLWQKIAIDHHWEYQYVPLKGNTDSNLTLLQNGQLDVIIGGISATYLRLYNVDFSRPYFLDSVIVVTHKPTANFASVKQFAKRALIYLAISFVACFILYVNLLWFFERGKIPEIPENYTEAMKNFLWFILLKKRFSIPVTTCGRIVSLAWIILTIFVFSSLNASLTSSLTVALNHHEGNIDNLQELQKIAVVATEGSSAAVAAANHGLLLKLVPTYPEAMQTLLDKKVDGLATNLVGATTYLAQHHLSDYVVNPYVLENEEYSFALPLNSPIRHAIDLGITKLQANEGILPLCQRFIPSEYIDRCKL